jgi:hypothetical protein
MRIFCLIGLLLFVSILMTASPKSSSSIKRIVETREGRKSCWGVVVQLKQFAFNKSVADSELSIIDGKYNRDMKGIMTWSVDKSRKKLTIKFKKGCGDFGTGDMVEVTIRSTALVGSQKEDIKLSISTDI